MMKVTDLDRLNFLHRGMVAQLDENALRDICQKLNFDYNALPGRGKQSRVWLMLEYLKEYGKLPQLYPLLQEKRPDVDWDAVLQGMAGIKSTASGSPSQADHGGNLLKNPIIIGALITACIGCAATLTVALVNGYFDLRTTDRPIQATQTAEARFTIEATKLAGIRQASPHSPQQGSTTMTVSQSPTSVSGVSMPTVLVQTSFTPAGFAILPAVTVIGTPDTPTPTSIPAPESETLTIYKSLTGVFFDGELVVAVFQYSWEDKKVTLGVSAPGFPEEITPDLTVGNRYRYEHNGWYEIVVGSFSGWSETVEVTITRLEEPPRRVPTTETTTICQDNTDMVFNKSLTIAVKKISSDPIQISFDVFAAGKPTLSIENQPVGKKFTYQNSGNYEIQIMSVNSFGGCTTLDIRRLP